MSTKYKKPFVRKAPTYRAGSPFVHPQSILPLGFPFLFFPFCFAIAGCYSIVNLIS